jgi:hypothetical protein
MVSVNASGAEIHQRHGILAGTQSAGQVSGPAVNVGCVGLGGLRLSRWQIDDCGLQDSRDAPNGSLMIEIKPKRTVSA